MSELGRGGHPADAVDAVDAVDGDGDVVDAPPSTDAGGVGVADVDAAEVSDRTVDADRAPRGMSDRYVDDDDDIFTGTDDAEDRDSPSHPGP